jgi:hypothetical protein
MALALQDDHAHARVYLSTLTSHQLDLVLNYVNTASTAVVRDQMATLRSQAAGPPMLAFVDLDASVDSLKLWHLIANFMPYVISDWLASDMGVKDYYEILVKGAGVDPALAQNLAEQIITPDGAVSNFAQRAMNAILDLPIVRDIEMLHKIGDVVAESAASIIASVGIKNAGRDNSYEGVLAGEKLYDMMQRNKFMAGQYAYEGSIHGKGGAPKLESGDPADDGDDEEVGDYGYDEEGEPYNLDSALRDAMGYSNTIDETGDPIAVDPERIAAGRQAISMWLEDVMRASPTGYHRYAATHPEQGGLFSGIGKALKKIGKKALKFVKKAAPGIIGGLVGGPVGMLAGGALTAGLSAASRKKKKPKRLGTGTPALTQMMENRKARRLPAGADKLTASDILTEVQRMISQSGIR